MIDWARVRELQDEIGAEDFGEIVEVFMEEVEAAIGALPDADKGSELEELMHLIKGCAWNLGFRELGKLCAAGEAAAEAGNGGSVDIDAVMQAFEAAQKVFTEGLQEQRVA
ncbi:Hpt domain-containing protein [Dinoroseobacter sp. PD6]|uniref:Hpt domain-containing protein n=1 Tax=Dinoroseobacter sp. PD6 TaxID=3028384 RepID=UPI00237A409A|nr:Hpt domain-containing protein [Dinoroseobacter sp. PD6]MDD9718064.1 Hpt domain-containing protein [Dinoroseobacter sp. PD6]